MRLAAAILLVLVMACGSSSAAAKIAATPSTAFSPTAVQAPTPTPSSSPSAAASPSPVASPTPFVFKLPAPTAPPAVPSGDCALPVYWADYPQNSVQMAFTVYPTGAIVTPQQTVNGATRATYDAAAGRWLPVGPEGVSPDGLQFAYAEYDLPPNPTAGMAAEGGPHAAGALATTGRVHLMNARTGADQVLFSGSPTYRVVGFTNDGIYLVQVAITMDGEFASGLFLLPISGGRPGPAIGGDRPLDRSSWLVENGAAWGTDYSAGIGGLQPGNELVELDLHTGAVTVWLTEPEGSYVGLMGFDAAGSPLVGAGASGYSSTGSPPPTPPTQLIALAAPQQAKVLWQTTDTAAAQPLGPVYDNAGGAWMGGLSSVWLDASGTVTKTQVDINGIVGVGAACQ
jgi:hypothetical protein